MKKEEYFGPITNNKPLVLLYRKIFRKDVPYWFRKRSILLLIWIPIRKFINVVIIPNIPFNKLRILFYRMIGYKIGKNVFIGMKCYLDDAYPSKIVIEDNVGISYGCYFASHGQNMAATNILIKKNTYIGTASVIIAIKGGLTVGENVTISAASFINNDIDDNTVVMAPQARVLLNKDKFYSS